MPASYSPEITAGQIKQIPPYPDPLVDFSAYAKRLKNDSYELLNQEENSIRIGIGTNLAGLPAGTYSISLGHSTQNFIFKGIAISYIQAGVIQNLSLSDSAGTNGISFHLPPSTGNIIQIPCIAKVIKGNTINITLSAAIPVNEFISVSLYGWYENR